LAGRAIFSLPAFLGVGFALAVKRRK
jgi:hypothetical protein